VLLTAAAVLTALGLILGRDGFGWLDLAMAAAIAVTLPWTLLGFWNAVIGLVLLHRGADPVGSLLPLTARDDGHSQPLGRTALLMLVHDEEPAQVFRHLEATAADIDASGHGEAFEIFILSDTRDPGVAAEEERRFLAWRGRDPRPGRLHYRRRSDNVGFKAGNMWEFLERRGDAFDYVVPLDADSLMGAASLLRLVRIMDRSPDLGILQTLVTGLPSRSAFARIFQFGMRHGMRAYTAGSVWWQGDAGPYWGHNAIIRTAPFMAHCRLPRLNGSPPLGGHVLSHDQVEAALMRGAGWKVHVIPEETASFEENPPTLPDFMKRDLRWCQGNMQYFRLLGMPGLRPMGRLQLGLAILMYVAAPAWLTFVALGMARIVEIAAAGEPVGWDAGAAGMAVALFGVMMTMSLAPKLAGLADVLLRRETRAAYGGTPRILASGLIELVFSLILGPIMALAQTVFIAGLGFGRAVGWRRQQRASRRVGWGEAMAGLWPQALLGAVMLGLLASLAPSVLPWATPIIAGLLLAIPFARLTSLEGLGLLLERAGLCLVPEETAPPPVLRRAGFTARTDPSPMLAETIPTEAIAKDGQPTT